MLSRLATAAASAILFFSVSAQAQYQIYFAEGFEQTQSKMPPSLLHGHHSTPLTSRAVKWDQTPFGEQLYTLQSAPVIGQYGLELVPLDSDPHLSLVDQRALLREKLGAKGAALFQVDFFVPEDTTQHPTMAILANAFDGGDRSTYQFYRFGIDRDRVYFSFTNNKSSPDIYERQNLSEFNLKPGWHRLQMIFKGQDQILCAIDGQLTAFSPLNEGSLGLLEPGIMVTKGKATKDTPVFADNLEIHWTPDSRVSPSISPWVSGSNLPAPTQGLYLNRWNLGGFEWLISPHEAWTAAASENKVIFAVFHDDNATANEKVAVVLGDRKADSVLSQCIRLRVDVKDGSGYSFAQRFNITEFPSLAVINKEGNLMSAVQVKDGITWERAFKQLGGS